MRELFRYEIKTESQNKWTDISRLINSEDTSITNALCTTEWKSATNTASFSLRYSDKILFSSVLSSILTARDDGERIDVKITSIQQDETVFSGYLDDSSISISSAAIPQSLSLSARDYITDLDNKIKQNIVYENEKVRSLVASLLQMAGYDGSIYSEIPEDRVVEYFVQTSDDDDTYRDVIDQLLFECGGYVLYRNPTEDRYEIRKIVSESEPERIAHYVIGDTLSTSAEIFDNDGIKIVYPTVSTKTGAVLYVADIQTSVEDGELKGEEIQPGHYYPADGDISPTYQEYDSTLLDRAYQTNQSRKQNDDISLLYAKNARVNINPSDGFDFPVLDNLDMPSNPVFYPKKAWVLIRNNTNEVRDLFTFTIEGDAIYKSRLNKVMMPEASKNPEEYETKYIFTQDDAVAFGTFYLNYRRLSSSVTTWTEKEPVSKLGEKVIVRHKGTDISQAHVIVQINDESFSGGVRCYRITAVSVSGYSEYTWAAESYSGSVISKQIVSDSQQYYYSTSYTQMQDGTWFDSPQNIPGTALWVRRKIVYTDGSIWLGEAYCAVNKPEDGAPKYYYKYTKTNNPDAYKGGGILFAYKDKLLAVGSSLLSAGMGGWADHVPEGPQYEDDYLWTKIVHSDGSIDIIPPPKDGKPAYGVDIEAKPESFQLTSRGVVKDDPAIINLSLKRHNVTASAVWALSPSDKPDKIALHIEADDSDKASVVIQKGADIKEFSVKVEIGEHDVSDSIVISGIDGGVPVPHYFGIYPKDEEDARPTYNKDTRIFNQGYAVFPDYVEDEGEIMKGDFIIFMTDVVSGSGDNEKITVEPIPYYYTGSVWTLLDSSAENYSQIMGSLIGDITSMPDVPVTTGAIYGFFQNLAATNAFITNLFANSIELQNLPGKIGDIHSQGYYRGAYLNSLIKSGFFLGADGYIELFKAILRDVQIISENNDGEVIFSVVPLNSGLSYSKAEIASVKSFSDLFPSIQASNFAYSISVNGKSCYCYTGGAVSNNGYNYIHEEDYIAFNREIESGTSLEIVPPYSCKIEIRKRSGGGTVSVFDISVDSDWKSFDVAIGSTIFVSASGGFAFVDIRTVNFPVTIGGENHLTFNDFGQCTNLIFIYSAVAADSSEPYYWPVAAYNSFELSSSIETGIVYNNQDFDDMVWRLSNNDISDAVSNAIAVFGEGELFTAESGCYIKAKNLTISNITAFRFDGGILTIQTSSTQTDNLTFQDDVYAKSLYLKAKSVTDAVQAKSIVPTVSADSQLGSSSKKFDNIYCNTLHANSIIPDPAENAIAPIYTYDGDNDYYEDFPGFFEDKTIAIFANSGFRLWSDRFIEAHFLVNVSANESKTVAFTLPSFSDFQLEFLSYPSVSISTYAESASTNVSYDERYRVFAVKNVSKTGCTIVASIMPGTIHIEAKGKLTSSCFNNLKSKLGV